MSSAESIGRRKDDHVRHAADQQREGFATSDFDCVTFVHHALAGIDRTQVNLATEFAGVPWPTPLYINAMTGGSAHTGEINRDLAIAARETGLAIASGSMSAYLRDESVADTYRVLRRENPHGFVMANVNPNATVDQARRAVGLLEANALQIHLNPVQEIVMPEGDRDFSHWPRQIERIVTGVRVPVIVKEVGFGLSRKTVELLRDIGVTVADVGGSGGTDFARIENNRRAGRDLGYLQGWGQSTVCCLLATADVTGIDVAASGGIRTPLDIARCLALGATAAGVAGRFLKILVDDGLDHLVGTIRDWLDQLASIMTVLGAPTPAALTACDLLLTGDTETWSRLLGIDTRTYAHRSLLARTVPPLPRQTEPTRERIPR
ncbi:type 2 isopentenyl-diphosphate Delta-isomerase [Nocardia sp. alder85J]|uniref:type 2 isopentenyl-diphosphate Delta-isomerase n=1 Tax=Nocardia sp. alder85J TaxID=2862949 RepID=UPI001CD31128|nr:type 2 isopentenyl-diphosphate Delta-isomerase [Nocardia sp. alder85J]MCX4095784.1 type 2 isopentenyl-diphosphate Delta-isomerase [Nocardia sp. alder85J]